MAPSKTDQQLLIDNLLDAYQDDDVDTDEDVLNSAMRSCESDLRKAENRITRDDGSYSYSIVRNIDIKMRTQRPDFYDRNGVYRDRLPADQNKQELEYERGKEKPFSCRLD